MADQERHIAELAESLETRLIQTRRDLHAYPEPSGREARTAGIVAERLSALGLAVREGVGGHGVVGTLEGAGPGPIAAWRADMDALPMDDRPGTPYASLFPGLSHACGHDAHTAIGLGAAEVLAAMRGELAGTVRFLFQPAEETAMGAKAMLADGALGPPFPSAIFGLHVSPSPAGQVALMEGTCLAAISRFSVTLRGRAGSSAAVPGLVAAELVDALERRNLLRHPTNAEELDAVMHEMEIGTPLLTGFIHVDHLALEPSLGSQGTTVAGSVFAASDELQRRAAEIIRGILGDLTQGRAVDADLAFREFVPATSNHPEVARLAGRAAEKVLGGDKVRWLKAPWPFGGEDFAYYLHQLPGALVFLGAADRQRGMLALPHHPDFDLDERALVAGTKVAASILVEALDRPLAPWRP